MKHEKLRARIEKRGFSQRQLAMHIGMDPGDLCNKLAGKRRFLWPEVLAICRVLWIKNPIGWFEP